MLLAIDLETTGVNPATAEVLQIAAVSEREVLLNIFCKPERKIPLDAQLVHGIDDAAVRCSVRGLRGVQLLETCVAPDTCLVTYNGQSYDLPILARYGFAPPNPHIDVYRLVQRDSDLNRHGLKLNQVFAGYIGDELDDAHDAGADAAATLLILGKYLEDTGQSASQLVEALSIPQVLQICYFGKHAGQHFDDVPTAYLRYIRKTFSSLSIDMRATLEAYGV